MTVDIEKLKALALAEFIEWARTDEGNCSPVDLRKSLTGEDTFASALVERDWIVWQAAQRGLIAEVGRLRAAQTNSSSNFSSNCVAPAAGTVEKDAAYDVLKSIIQDGYLSDTNTARGHAAIEAHTKAGKEEGCGS
jgi:hypothetical protein